MSEPNDATPEQANAKPSEGQSSEAAIRARLDKILDPEIGFSILELGLVYAVRVSETEKKAEIDMTLTTPACPYGPQLLAEVKAALLELGYPEPQINVVWTPPWNPAEMASDRVKDLLGIW